jgi:hypothetical protein
MTQRIRSIWGATILLAAILGNCPSLFADAPTEKFIHAPHGLQVSIKMIGPVTEQTDLQIVCILQHNPAGDKYIDAMRDLNDKLGGLLSNLLDHGDFLAEPGETLLISCPPKSITPTRLLLIGVGEESSLSLDRMRLAGRIAARQAVQLNAAHVSFAPTLRDQGSTRIDVADGDAAVLEQFLLAYDGEKRLQAQGLSPKDDLKEFTIEAGPKFFDRAVEKAAAAVTVAAKQIQLRDASTSH